MSSTIKNVMIIGASGHLGPYILNAFKSSPNFAVSVLSRTDSTSTFPSDVKVHRVSTPYIESELVSAFTGQDAIISAIATAVAGNQKVFIDAAIKAGVKRFVPSEFGSDTENEKAMEILPQYFKGKKGTVEYLQEKFKEGTNGELKWTAFVTGLFFDLAMISGFMGFNLKEQKAQIFNAGSDKWSTTTSSSIGQAVKNAMLHPETENKYIYVDSFTVSQNQVLAALEKATGKTWDVILVDGEAEKKIGIEKMAKGDFSGAMSLIRYINCVSGHGGNYAEYKETSNQLLELPKEELNEVVQKIVGMLG